MRVLIIGASGMLGFALHRVLHDAGHEVLGSVRAPQAPQARGCADLRYETGVDVERFEEVRRCVGTHGAEFVVNATGVKSTGAAAGQRRRLFAVNAVFPRKLGALARQLGVRVVQFSSDGVFSGTRGGYLETDPPDAEDDYGLSKLLGEPDEVEALVIRTSLLGRGIVPNDSLVDWFLARREPVRGYRRSIFSGLPVDEIARIFAGHVLPRLDALHGVYHVSAQPISKLDLLQLLKAEWGLAVAVEPVDGPALDRSLDSARFRRATGYEPAPWPELLARMHAFYERAGQLR